MYNIDRNIKSEGLTRFGTNRPNTNNTSVIASPSKHIKKAEKPEFPRKDYNKPRTFGFKKKETTKNGLELQFFHKTKICPF